MIDKALFSFSVLLFFLFCLPKKTNEKVALFFSVLTALCLLLSLFVEKKIALVFLASSELLWLFSVYGKKSFDNRKILQTTLFQTLLYAIPLSCFLGQEKAMPAEFLSFAMVFFFVTKFLKWPVSTFLIREIDKSHKSHQWEFYQIWTLFVLVFLSRELILEKHLVAASFLFALNFMSASRTGIIAALTICGAFYFPNFLIYAAFMGGFLFLKEDLLLVSTVATALLLNSFSALSLFSLEKFVVLAAGFYLLTLFGVKSYFEKQSHRWYKKNILLFFSFVSLIIYALTNKEFTREVLQDKESLLIIAVASFSYFLMWKFGRLRNKEQPPTINLLELVEKKLFDYPEIYFSQVEEKPRQLNGMRLGTLGQYFVWIVTLVLILTGVTLL